MLRLNWILGLAAAGLVAACSPAAMRDPGADTAARSAFDKARSYPTSDLPATPPRARSPVNTAAVTLLGQGSTVRMTDEYDFGDRKALVYTEVHKAAGQSDWKLIAFQTRVATARELAANGFTLAGKSPVQLLLLLYLAACAALMIAALVKVIRTPGLRRKWLWGILAFLGVGSIQMDWTTGHLALVPLTIQIIGLGVMRGPSSFAPWIVSATLPVGAALILAGVWANPARAKPSRSKSPSKTAPASPPW